MVGVDGIKPIFLQTIMFLLEKMSIVTKLFK